MTTYNTGNPLGSAAAKDLFDNAQNLDFAVNSITQVIWQDRFGRSRKTWYGLQKDAQEAIAAFGYITIDSFENGASITLPNQVLRWESNGEYYRWDGELPKDVPAGSTPESTGGINLGAWLSVGDATLRGNLASADGYKLIGEVQSFSDLRALQPTSEGIRVKLRGYYADTLAGGGDFIGHLSDEADDSGIHAAGEGYHWERVTGESLSVMMFGAFGDGVTDDTLAMQSALNASAGSGKTLKFPGGFTFLYSARQLIKSNTSIVIESGCTLKRTGTEDGYTWVNGDGSGSGGYVDCLNVSIELKGTVDLNGANGRSTAWLTFAHGQGLHVFGGGQVINSVESHPIEVNSYKNVLIENIRFPTHNYYGTDNYECIQIDFSNADGFPAFGPWDNTACENVTIKDCYFGTGHTGVGTHSTPTSGYHNNIRI